MSLKEDVKQDIIKAMKEKNELLVLVLKGISSEIHNKEIEKKQELTDEDVLIIISSEAKKRKDAIEGFKQGKRDDLAEKEIKELEILKIYLPEQIGEEEIKQEAKKAIEEVNATGPQDTGKVMSILMGKLKGKAEGGLVSKIVGELLKNDN